MQMELWFTKAMAKIVSISMPWLILLFPFLLFPTPLSCPPCLSFLSLFFSSLAYITLFALSLASEHGLIFFPVPHMCCGFSSLWVHVRGWLCAGTQVFLLTWLNSPSSRSWLWSLPFLPFTHYPSHCMLFIMLFSLLGFVALFIVCICIYPCAAWCPLHRWEDLKAELFLIH